MKPVRVTCAECPWRKDVEPGQISITKFVLLRSCVEKGFNPMFGCHLSPEPCVGYLLCDESMNNFTVRLAYIDGQFSRYDMQATAPLYETYEAMAQAHGVEPVRKLPRMWPEPLWTVWYKTMSDDAWIPTGIAMCKQRLDWAWDNYRKSCGELTMEHKFLVVGESP